MSPEREIPKEIGETCASCNQTIDPKKANKENFRVGLRMKDNPDKVIPYHFDCLKKDQAQGKFKNDKSQ